MSNKRFVYTNDKQITASKVDNTNNFIWLAFAQNSSGICILEKQHPFTPTQTFHSLNISVNQINKLDLNSTNLYAIYDSSTLFVERFSLNNPNTSRTSVNFPSGVIESPIDLVVDNTDVFILTPGSISGENAKILKYNTSLVFQEEIDLTKSGSTVTDASSITISGDGDLWVSVNQNPSQYVRVFELSGGGYDFTIFTV